VSARTAAQTIKPKTFDIDPPEADSVKPVLSDGASRDALYAMRSLRPLRTPLGSLRYRVQDAS